MQIKIVLTGATGMVGEGVLFECLQHPNVSEVLSLTRRHYDLQHPKLKELIVPDFTKLGDYAEALKGYDACLFCAGISSVGMQEDEYTHITYDVTLAVAKTLLAVNERFSFCFISGAHTNIDSRQMWARVKGRTETELNNLPFAAEYNFRPGGMMPSPGQKNAKTLFKVLVGLIKVFSPKSVISLSELGRSMINAVIVGYPKPVLEIADIKLLATRASG